MPVTTLSPSSIEPQADHWWDDAKVAHDSRWALTLPDLGRIKTYLLGTLETTLELLEKDIFAENYKRSTVVRLYELKRELNKMRMAVAPLQDVLSALRRYPAEAGLVPDEVKLYIRDVHDHAVRISDVIDTLREMLGTALSVNLSLVTLAQGETVKRLGAWAALLAAPTLITSWYGMNFTHMPELSWRYGYPFALALMALTGVGLFLTFKRRGWL